MISFRRLRISWLAAAAVLVMAFGLSACGRKGGLDPPPAAALPRPAGTAGPGGGANGQAPEANGKRLAAQPKRSEPFFLDWLLN